MLLCLGQIEERMREEVRGGMSTQEEYNRMQLDIIRYMRKCSEIIGVTRISWLFFTALIGYAY